MIAKLIAALKAIVTMMVLAIIGIVTFYVSMIFVPLLVIGIVGAVVYLVNKND